MRVVLIVALAVRVALVALGLASPERFVTPDGVQYLALGKDLWSGYLNPESDTFVFGLSRTPIYPVFVALWLALGQGFVVAVIAAQIALALLVVAMTFLLVKKLLGGREAMAAAFILSIDPASALYSVFVQPETLFTLTVLLAVWAWINAIDTSNQQTAAVAGVLMGLAALTRPIAVALPVVFGAVAFVRVRRPGLPLLAACFLPFLLVVSAWVTRNAVQTGAPVLSTIEGVNLLYYRAAEAMAIEKRISMDVARAQLEKKILESPNALANPARRSQAESALAWRVLTDHPFGAFQSAARGVVNLFAGTGFTALSNLGGDPRPTTLDTPAETGGAALLAMVLFVSYLAAALGAVDLLRSGNYGPLLILLALGGYFVMMAAGPEANTRFRVPAMPFIAALGGRGLIVATDWWTRRFR